MLRVTFRSNSGEDFTAATGLGTLEDARKIAKSARVTDNHMVCIEDMESGERLLRWDRARIVGENRWRKVDTEAFECLGEIATVIRRRGHNG